jgi:hypothetical protein
MISAKTSTTTLRCQFSQVHSEDDVSGPPDWGTFEVRYLVLLHVEGKIQLQMLILRLVSSTFTSLPGRREIAEILVDSFYESLMEGLAAMQSQILECPRFLNLPVQEWQ